MLLHSVLLKVGAGLDIVRLIDGVEFLRGLGFLRLLRS